MTDREHRIDTGSPEERVKAKWPDAQCTESANRTHVIWSWDNGKCTWLGEKRTEQAAWADAASRLETK